MNKKVAAIVDQLGETRDTLKELRLVDQELATQLKGKGEGAYLGKHYLATVYCQERTTVDWEAIARALVDSIPPRLLRKHTSVTPIVACNVTERKDL